MPFVPESIQLTEGGEDNPYDWSMTVPLTWTGTFRGKIGRLLVPVSVSEPFTTDLASVPRSLTWLFPRYGRYTKAAVLHDYLCQNVGRDTIAVYPTPSDAVDGTRPSEPQLLVLADRSDADEIFRLVMTELRVPWARRWLMWSAVSWATLFTSIWPGRRSNPVLRWLGRLVLVAVAVAVVLLVLTGAVGSLAGQSPNWKWLRIVALVVIGSTAVAGSVLAAGYVALGRLGSMARVPRRARHDRGVTSAARRRWCGRGAPRLLPALRRRLLRVQRDASVARSTRVEGPVGGGANAAR